MSSTVTKGRERNDLSRIYDRLRKRSLRNINMDRTQDEHEAYVRGVRDGLNAAEDAGLLPRDNEKGTDEGAPLRYRLGTKVRVLPHGYPRPGEEGVVAQLTHKTSQFVNVLFATSSGDLFSPFSDIYEETELEVIG